MAISSRDFLLADLLENKLDEKLEDRLEIWKAGYRGTISLLNTVQWIVMDSYGVPHW